MSAEQAGGYLLAGGRSRRMGTDKAMLPWRGITLGAWVAGEIRAATGNLTVVGTLWPGYRSIPDVAPAGGPLSGIAACLADSPCEWNVICACDMPGVTREWLRLLLNCASGDVLIPESADGRLHPLCAVWHRRALGAVYEALCSGIRQVTQAITLLDYRTVAADETGPVANVNTPEEWARWQACARAHSQE